MKPWMWFTIKVILILCIFTLTLVGLTMDLDTTEVASGDSVLGMLALGVFMKPKKIDKEEK